MIASGWSAPSGRPQVLPKTYGTAKWERGLARSQQLVKALSQKRQHAVAARVVSNHHFAVQLNHFITKLFSFLLYSVHVAVFLKWQSDITLAEHLRRRAAR